MKRVALAAIRFYQRFISPIKGPTCRFTPTCSTYAYQSIHKHGLLYGSWLSIKRLLKCHPFHPGGYDPVPDRDVGGVFLAKGFTVLLVLLAGVLLLSGCSPDFSNMKPIDPNGGFWDRFFVWPLSWTLDQMAMWMWGSYGLSILAVTLIIRALLFPLMHRQMRSSKQMQVIQPELVKLQKKYKGNQEKLQQEMMKLFQKHNYNPFMGCLPILIQMPILIAFYNAIIRNSEIREHSFLWMNLGQPDPIFLLPVLAAISTYVQLTVTRRMMPTPAEMTPQFEQQQQMFRMMQVVFPAMIMFIGITLPSALSLYWVYSNLISILQTYLLYRMVYGTPVQEGAAR